MLFTRNIRGKADWADVFCDTEAFCGLVHEALRRHGLLPCEVTGLTPGTNAVFRAGDYVVKLYAPPESGFSDGTFGRCEWQAMQAASAVGVTLPKLLAYGMIHDRYDFAYIIMEYINCRELGNVMPVLTPNEKYDIGRKLRVVSENIHRADISACPDCTCDLVNRALSNPSFDLIPETLAYELKERAKKIPTAHSVLVHGDLTGENVLIGNDGLTLMDFGDAVIAPPCYELPALVIEGMHLDACAVSGFYGGELECFVKETLDGLSLHLFSGQLIGSAADIIGVPITEITSIDMLKNLLICRLERSAR